MSPSKLLRAVVAPPSKLECSFPWTWREATKNYMKSLWYFAIGSFVIPLTFVGGVLALCQYTYVKMLFLEPEGVRSVLKTAWLTGSLAVGATYLWLWRRNIVDWFSGSPPPPADVTPLKRWRLRVLAISAHHTLRLITHSLAGGAAFTLLFVLAIALLDPYYPKLMQGIAAMLSDEHDQPNMTFVMTLSLVAFVLGFGMQMRFIDKSLKKSGESLRSFMALNLDKRRGRAWWITLIKVVWPAAVALILWQGVEWLVVQALGPSSQATVEMARKASGGNFLMFVLMAAVGAPLFEEFVFRGYLFQVVRGALSATLPPVELVDVPVEGRWLKLRSTWAKADNWVRRTSHRFSQAIHNILGGKRMELTAVLFSSFMFAILHLQFQPSALVLLFLLGCLHAEVYRRTGSLYCSMLLHAANNGIAVFLIWSAK